MNTIAITKITIMQELARLPETSLDTVKIYLETLLTDAQTASLKNQSLQGIWKDQGFEKIVDLPKELHQIRQELRAHK